MEKYFNENREYEGPILIKFDEPVTIKLHDINKFLDYYKPSCYSEAWPLQVGEVGDFNNFQPLILESIGISPEYSNVYREDAGIYKAGETRFEKVIYAWYYREDKPFWTKPTQRLYIVSHKGYKYIDEVEITLDGVYVISSTDKRKMEEENLKSNLPKK